MALLWTKVARSSLDETHDEHSLHPAFEAAGIRHAPCAYVRCDDFDEAHSDVFDEAENRFSEGHHQREDVDLSKPLYGFEPTCDMHTLRRYTKHPESRSGDPAIFRHQGKHYIFNGHHGISGALRRGDKTMPMDVVDLDKD
jgi:hypothetical protein